MKYLHIISEVFIYIVKHYKFNAIEVILSEYNVIFGIKSDYFIAIKTIIGFYVHPIDSIK